eukprot:546656_1
MSSYSVIWIQTCIICICLTQNIKLYGQTQSLQMYNLTDGSITTIVAKPNVSYYGWTNAGLGCYDAKNDRIYYMGEGGDDGIWWKYGIYGFDLKTNTSLTSIIVTEYFAHVSPFPHTVLEWNLLFCNPTTGELFIWGLSPVPNSSAYVLYNVHDIIYFNNNSQVNFQITLIGTYVLQQIGGGFSDAAHIFDTKRNAIWFTTNTAIHSTIYYSIDCDNGTFSQIQTNYSSMLSTGVYYDKMDIIVAVQWNYMVHQLKMLHIDPVSFDVVKEFNWMQFPNTISMGIPSAIDNVEGIFYEMGFGQTYTSIYGINVETSDIVINVTYEGDWHADDLFVAT